MLGTQIVIASTGGSISIYSNLYVACRNEVHAGQPDTLNEPVDWDLLPNGMLVVQYDSTGDGVPDHVTLHQITWSGWTAQTLPEIKAQVGKMASGCS